MTDIVTPLPPARHRPARSRKRPARPRHHRRLLIPHRRVGLVRIPYADAALNALMQEGDLYKVRGTHYLVAPVTRELLATLIVAAGATEDDEPNGDLEPSVGDDQERESDGLDDTALDWRGGGDMALGWANEGSQAHLTGNSEETEPELGWADTGSQLRLAVQAPWCDTNAEGDGDCDAEEDDPSGDPLDRGEFDPCDLGEPEEYLDGYISI